MTTDTHVEAKTPRKAKALDEQTLNQAQETLSELDAALAEATKTMNELGEDGALLQESPRDLFDPVASAASTSAPTAATASNGISPHAPTPRAPVQQAAPQAAQAAEIDPRVATVARGMIRDQQRQDRNASAPRNFAREQRERGYREILKDYTGAMVVRRSVKVYDVKLAASLERYLGIVDSALYQLVRSGPGILGSGDTFDLMESFEAMILKHEHDAKQASDTTAAMLAHERQKVFADEDWFVPEYTGATVDVVVKMKHPLTRKLIIAIEGYEKALTNLNILAWNVKLDPAQNAQMRDEHSRAIKEIFRFSTRVFMGLRGRLQPTPSREGQQTAALFKPSAIEEPSALAMA